VPQRRYKQVNLFSYVSGIGLQSWLLAVVYEPIRLLTIQMIPFSKQRRNFNLIMKFSEKKHLQHELRNQSDGIHWRRRCLRLHPVSLG
jgi:hypothetical protein